MHVPLGRRDIGVPQHATGELDPLLSANLRPALVPGQIQHQVPRQAGQVPQPGVRPAEIGDPSRFPSRGEKDRFLRSRADRLIEQPPELSADRDSSGLPCLAGGLMLPQDGAGGFRISDFGIDAAGGNAAFSATQVRLSPDERTDASVSSGSRPMRLRSSGSPRASVRHSLTYLAAGAPGGRHAAFPKVHRGYHPHQADSTPGNRWRPCRGAVGPKP